MQTSREKRTRKSHKITMKRLLPSFAFNKNIPTTKQFQCLSNTIKEKQNCWETVPLAFFTTNLSIETDVYNHTRAPVDLLILKSWLFAAYLLTWILCNTLKHWEVCVSKYLLAKITKLHGSDLGKSLKGWAFSDSEATITQTGCPSSGLLFCFSPYFTKLYDCTVKCLRLVVFFKENPKQIDYNLPFSELVKVFGRH